MTDKTANVLTTAEIWSWVPEGLNAKTNWLTDCMDWIHLAQDTDQWRAIVNSELNILVASKVENFLIIKRLLAS